VSFAVTVAPGKSWHTCADYVLVSDDQTRAPAYGCHREETHLDRLQAEWLARATRITTANEDVYRFWRQSREDMRALRLHEEDYASNLALRRRPAEHDVLPGAVSRCKRAAGLGGRLDLPLHPGVHGPNRLRGPPRSDTKGSMSETLVTYDGATTIGVHLLPDVAPLYGRLGYRFGAIGDRGTNKGLEAARAGKVDVAGVMRELTAQEKAELRWALVGYDALGVFVSEENRVRGVSRAQLKGIFTGAIRSWKELGGADAPVLPVTEIKTGGRGTVLELKRLALDGDEYGETREYEDAPDCLRHVASDPSAVTAASMSMAIPGVRAIAIDGAEPTASNLRAGGYLLGRPMYLVSRTPAPAAVETLLGLLLSPQGQAVVGRKFTPAR